MMDMAATYEKEVLTLEHKLELKSLPQLDN